MSNGLCRNQPLTGFTEWIDFEFVERERTFHEIIEIGIQFYLAGLSFSNTKQCFDTLGVDWSQTTTYNGD